MRERLGLQVEEKGRHLSEPRSLAFHRPPQLDYALEPDVLLPPLCRVLLEKPLPIIPLADQRNKVRFLKGFGAEFYRSDMRELSAG